MSHLTNTVFLTPKIGPYCTRSLTINLYSELSDRVDNRIMYHLCADTIGVVSNCLNLLQIIFTLVSFHIFFLLFSFYLFRILLSIFIFILIFFYYLSNFSLVKLHIIINCIITFIININS